MASASNTTTTTSSRLLALPPELRNKIWEYTMIGGKFLLLPSHLLPLSLS